MEEYKNLVFVKGISKNTRANDNTFDPTKEEKDAINLEYK